METTKTTKTWKKIVIALLAAILLVMTPMAVAANVNNAGNLKTVAGITAEAKQKNEFYQPYFNAHGSGVQVIPAHVWYKNGNMYADCYVVNMQRNNVTNIVVNRLALYNNSGKIADAGFGKINGMSLAPGQYATHRFVFQKGSFKKGADLTKNLNSKYNTSYKNI